MAVLPRHGPQAAHLPHQPLQHLIAAAQIGGQKAPRFFSQVLQNRATLKHRHWRAASSGSVVNDGRHAVVRADGQKRWRKLLSLANVDGHKVIRQAALFKHDGNLPAVGRGPVVQVNHRGFLMVLVVNAMLPKAVRFIRGLVSPAEGNAVRMKMPLVALPASPARLPRQSRP